MQAAVYFTFIYAIFIVLTIVPAFKKKQWKALWFAIPVFLLTYTINLMVAFGAEIISPNELIMDLVNSIIKQ